MRKYLFYISLFFTLILIFGCSDEQEKSITGEFYLRNFGADFKDNEIYHLVVPIEWTGESSVTIKSIDLIKSDQKPISYEEDGMKYEFFGADPLKSSGIYGDSDIGDLKSINNFEFKGEGRIVFKFSLTDVKKDSERRVKINFSTNGKEYEKIVQWNTLEQLATKND